MSLVNSSVIMLLTALAADRLEPFSVAAGQPRGHEPAVASTDHAGTVAIAERVAVERRIEHREHILDVDAAPARSRRGMVLGSRIAWPHFCSRPDPPRGLLITTTKPAAACTWDSSKVSPYWVRATVHIQQHG
jgi:hypothetical protein